MVVQKNPVWLTSVSGPANQSTEDAETLNLLWKPNLEIYGLQVVKGIYDQWSLTISNASLHHHKIISTADQYTRRNRHNHH